MANFTLKNIPTELLERLRQSAEKNYRSINSEMLVLLDEALSQDRSSVTDWLAELRRERMRTAITVTNAEIDKAKREGRK